MIPLMLKFLDEDRKIEHSLSQNRNNNLRPDMNNLSIEPFSPLIKTSRTNSLSVMHSTPITEPLYQTDICKI